MPKGPLGFSRLTSLGPFVEEKKSKSNSDEDMESTKNKLKELRSPMLADYILKMSRATDLSIGEVIESSPVEAYAERLGILDRLKGFRKENPELEKD